MADSLGKVRVPFQNMKETLTKLTVPELQQELKRRSLKRSGVKAKLIERLLEAINRETEAEEAIAEAANASSLSTADTTLDDSTADSSLDHSNANASFSQSIVDTSLPLSTLEARYTQEDAEHEDANPVQTDERKNPAAVQSQSSNNTGENGEGISKEPINHQEIVQETDNMPQYIPSAESQEINAECESSQSVVTVVPEASEVPQATVAPLGIDCKETGPQNGNTSETNIPEEMDVNPLTEDQPLEEEEKSQDGEESKVAMAVEPEDAEIYQPEEGSPHLPDETDSQKPEPSPEQVMETVNIQVTERPEKEETLDIELSQSDKADMEDFDDEYMKTSDSGKKEKKPEKKQSVPVQIKKRKMVVPDSGVPSVTADSLTPRKRRWGSSASKESLTISSESLKVLIPEVSIIPPSSDDPLGLGLDYGDMEEGEIDDSMETAPAEVSDSEMKDGNEADAGKEKDKESFTKEVKRGRIVRISTKDTVMLQTMKSTEKVEETEEENVKEATVDTVTDEKVSLLPEIPTEEAEPVPERLPSPAKNPPSQVLSILNLVRPFTLRQLKELLGKTGSIVEEGFWINKIKSHCYVTYETVEEAEVSRNAIHGTKWPSGNPKVLSVDFALNDAVYRMTEGKLGTAPEPITVEIEEPKARREEHERGHERAKPRERRSREMEKENYKHKEKEPEREKKAEDGGKPREKKEAPAKLLDDLFRKTKATPCIYWLPLTKEQIVERDKEREVRQEERKKERENHVARQIKEREERQKQREVQTQRSAERPRERRSPPPQHRGRRSSKSPEPLKRSPDIARRGNRNLPAQYRRRSNSPSS